MHTLKKALLTAALFVLSFAPGRSCHAQQSWIIGGQSATEGQFPWLGDIRAEFDSVLSHICGAALIHPRWVVTAAHCLDTSVIPIEGTKVRFNTVSTYAPLPNPNGGIEVKVKKFFPHPMYDFGSSTPADGYDVGLILLDEAVTQVTPIVLAPVTDTVAAYQTGMQVKIAGWGISDSVTLDSPDTLKWCRTKVYDYSACNSIATAIYGSGLNRNAFCAGYTGGEEPAGGAAGDSGGPVWAEAATGVKKLIGVVSGGFGEMTATDKPGIYTKLAAYKPWIDSVMAANNPTNIPSVAWNDEQIKIGMDAGNINLIFGDMEKGNVSVCLYNLEGKVLYNTTINSPAFKKYIVSTAGMSRGLYLLRIADNKGRSFTRKLVNTGF